MIPFRLSHYPKGAIVYEVQLDYAELNLDIPNSQFTKPQTPQLYCEG